MRVRVRSSGLSEGKGQSLQNERLDQTKDIGFLFHVSRTFLVASSTILVLEVFLPVYGTVEQFSCLHYINFFSIPEQLAKFGEFGDSLRGQIAD